MNKFIPTGKNVAITADCKPINIWLAPNFRTDGDYVILP